MALEVALPGQMDRRLMFQQYQEHGCIPAGGRCCRKEVRLRRRLVRLAAVEGSQQLSAGTGNNVSMSKLRRRSSDEELRG